MDPSSFAKLLNLTTEEEIEKASASTLDAFINVASELLSLNGNDWRKYLARDLRARVLFHLIPAKVLRRPRSDTPLFSADDIRSFILDKCPVPWQQKPIDDIVAVIQRYAIDLPTPRSRRTSDRLNLLETQNYCDLCGFRFDGSGRSILGNKRDALKPLTFREEFQEPCIDHRIPVGRLGSNRKDNLSVFCKQCNTGKSDYLSYSETRESSGWRNRKTLGASDVGKFDLRLFFSVIAWDRVCKNCSKGPSDAELTISTRDEERFFLFDNLYVTCYDCDKYPKRRIDLT